jgi:hypothetical protein
MSAAWAAWEAEKQRVRPTYGRVDYEGTFAGRGFGSHLAWMLTIAGLVALCFAFTCVGMLPWSSLEPEIRELSGKPAKAQLARDLGTLLPAGAEAAAHDVRTATCHPRGPVQVWYRFDLLREQIEPFRQHLIRTWNAKSGHLAHESRGADAMAKSGGPEWWDPDAVADCDHHLALDMAHGYTVFRIALSRQSGRVFVYVGGK